VAEHIPLSIVPVRQVLVVPPCLPSTHPPSTAAAASSFVLSLPYSALLAVASFTSSSWCNASQRQLHVLRRDQALTGSDVEVRAGWKGQGCRLQVHA
jgi:hypothetical protein